MNVIILKSFFSYFLFFSYIFAKFAVEKNYEYELNEKDSISTVCHCGNNIL